MQLRTFFYLTTVSLSILSTLSFVDAAEKRPPPYECDTDADCEDEFPGTVCIAVDSYGEVTRKCTPNTKSRPACRGSQPGLCPSYQSAEVGYLNAHCIFVARDVPDLETVLEGGSGSTKSDAAERFLLTTASTIKSVASDAASEEADSAGSAGSDEEDATAAEGDAEVIKSGKETYAKVTIGKKDVVGQFVCSDVSDCINQAYDTSTCEPSACMSPNSKVVCNNHGTCTYKSIQQMSKRSCSCYAGFSGEKCEKEVSNKCDVDCGMGGECVDGKCECKPGWDGIKYKGKQGKPNARCTRCTNDRACQNGSPCNLETGKCECLPGFFGETCGATEDSCATIKCGNNGNCQVLANGSSACFCEFCDGDCQMCKDKSCRKCPSDATMPETSKFIMFAIAILAVIVGNFAF